MKLLKKIAAAASAAVLISTVLPVGKAAAEYPDRPVKIIVPFSPGSSNDNLARLLAPSLSKALGQPVVVENKPGAGARIGIEAMTKSAADGHTILFSGGAVMLIPAVYKKVPWNPIKDIQPIAQLGAGIYAIGVNPKLKAKTPNELIALLKKNPGKYNAAAGGNSSQMATELFRVKTGTKFEIIRYKGTGKAATAVVSGETQFAIMASSGFVSLAPSGRIRMIGVANDERIPNMPTVPTTVEQGFDFKAGTFFGVYAQGGMPKAIVQRLNMEINKILTTPDVERRLIALGLDPRPVTVKQITDKYLGSIDIWKDVVKKAGIKRK
jgi:tripartite-type tricarboxylate transporter receptor subunit TctC